ncbi:uncharacterized protein TNCV_1286331 [Trichonephila clavipes]|uniref:Uncharacterized protein n=1 Tax=Trichonephila clavipes TaxID=2585209 RepID=A0A8X6SQW1_TRICX|nr:uncharacterized protein TNCV_1286331 [Trichonephila clavipes]
MQYRTRARNSACSFCNIVDVTGLHAMLIRLRKSDLLVDSRSYTLLFRKPQRKNPEDLGRGSWGPLLLTCVAKCPSNVSAKNVHGCADLCAGAPSCWYHMRDKSRKETSSSKKSANGPEKISVYDSDVKDPSKYIGQIKVLFHIRHYTFTDQRTWWGFGRIRCGFSRDQ